jgi:ABC-type sulfate transport system permease component
MSDESRPGGMIRKMIGFVIAAAGILFALSVGGFSAIIMLGYWQSENIEGRLNLTGMVVVSLLIGYGIYRLGRRIAR